MKRVLQKDKTFWVSVQSLRSGRFSASRFSCAKQIYLTNVHPNFSYVVNTLSGFFGSEMYYLLFSYSLARPTALKRGPPGGVSA